MEEVFFEAFNFFFGVTSQQHLCSMCFCHFQVALGEMIIFFKKKRKGEWPTTNQIHPPEKLANFP